MAKKKQQPKPIEPKERPNEFAGASIVPEPLAPPAPPVPKVVETRYVGVNFDDEITEQLPTLAAQCRFLHFTSAPSTQSMEAWQRLFEANGFLFLRDTLEPTVRSQLYQSRLSQ